MAALVSEEPGDAAPLAQFTALADGTIKGEQGRYGELAATLRFITRAADQMGESIGVGDLASLDTVSTTRLTAWLSRDLAGAPNLRVRVTRSTLRTPREFTILGDPDPEAALRQSVQAVNKIPGVQWSAVLSADARVVAAAKAAAEQTTSVRPRMLPDIGSRARGVLGALDERFRLSFVRLSYAGGVLVLASVGPHCLFAMADESVEEELMADTVDQVRALLEPYDLLDVPTVAERVAAAAEAVDFAPVEPTPPTPVGLRFRGR